MGVYLSEPETRKQTIVGAEGKMSFVSSQMQGWRKSMEDAAIHEINIGDGNSVFAVYDGHGGAQVSAYVAEIFVKLLKTSSYYQKKDYITALDETFKKIDEMIISVEGNNRLKQIRRMKASGDVQSSDMIGLGTGCTANVILMTPQKYIIANAGDSRSALSREGNLVVFSQDHKPESQVEIDRIQKAGGKVMMGRVEGGLNLTRSFGDFNYKKNQKLPYNQQMITCKPDIKVVPREGGDQFIIMGCDGIWQRYVDNSQGLLDVLKNQLKAKKDHKLIVQNLLDNLLAKNTQEGIGCDNMTAILIILK